ncbi:hypothetical protein CKAN_00380600 [Cinnamomum micranthum f. kanehirae]|uniref:Uncharacterized protein n=1 Tax=Cinnamomum micranthum f. kanehirae TaxID=337451 RepID=A0A3S3PXM8_9MAGN|nr:hypothetical protein CKAN_00380600 [Cinnamomum micranthum f. kanehirae]
MRVLRMTTETPGDVRIPISEEPENLGWLYKIIEESDPRILTSKPLIQKVAQTLRGITRNEACFDPSVVSFGPYHHGEEHLNPMERYKEVAALWFIKLSDNPGNAITREGVKQVYDEFVAKVPSVSLRECYTDKFVDKINDADFMRMMFLDVRCICCCLWLGDSRSEEGTEDSRFEEGTKDSRFEEGTELQTEPLHLLDLLRSELTGKGVDPSVNGTRHRNYNFRPISELKEEGIQVSASNSESLSLNNIKLKKGWIDSYLELPRIIIDDSTKTRLLNLAAYEMCPDGSLGQLVITSYICLLNSLIYNADDVKELRSSNIMLNRLGSDEEVVNLFRELATNLSPDVNAYSNVTHGMEKHSQRSFNRLRMWIGQFIRIYFTSPWTAISLTAAISVIFLTLVQTIYSILSYNLSKKSQPK